MSMTKWLGSMAGLVAGTFASAVAHAETARSEYNLPVGATEISAEVHDLHMLVLWVVTAIGVLVFGTMFYSIFAHRRSKHPKPADFHESTTVEIIWTIIPFFILIGMAIPAAGTLIKMEDSRNADLTVKVTGFQWGWKYEYIGEDYEFVSMLAADSNKARQLGSGIDPNTVPNYLWDVNNPLVLPTGKKVRFLITAQDVIHAWWVQDIAVKKDAIPGYINEAWAKIEQPGRFHGVCAELCGRDHGFMPIVVQAIPETEFKAWLARKKGVDVAAAAPVALTEAAPAPAAAPVAVAAAAPAAAALAPAKALSKDELMAQGKKVYEANCQACHQANGTGLPPNFPSLVGSKIVNGDAKAHVLHTLNGKNLMPPFKQLSDADIAAVASYERQSWGNKASLVQPADVTAAR
ncbi:MAG: cytochrome c oxidase subunit II [Stagnimonas sp.]|nr:cytochrome c oxidase subunit II [Stagnimonas sp.]